MNNSDYSNPVVKTTPLRAYPGWVVRQYADGMFDGTNGLGLTLGCKTFQEVVACIKADRPSTAAEAVQAIYDADGGIDRLYELESEDA